MSTFSAFARTDRAGLAGLVATVSIHVAILLFLLIYAPAREVLNSLAPLMVELIRPELPAPPMTKPEPRVELPKPLPVKRVQPQPEAPLLAAQAPVAAAEVVVAPEPKPVPPLEARPAPPAPVMPPNFNAAYLDNPAPVYSALSRRMGEQGKVLLRVFVEPDGMSSKVELRSSSGFERLDQAALDAVRRWKFVPAKQGDQAVGAWVVVPILFNLRG
jgi:protein TonB